MKNFVVTGSTKGIGHSIVSEILEKYDDAFVYMSYAHDDKSAEICKTFWEGRVCVSKVDLSSYSEMKEYCSFLKNKIDSIFALVLNAGIGYKAPFEELDIDEEVVEEIYDYFKHSTTDAVDVALDNLDGDIYEEDVRLVRIKFISEMAN